MAVKKTFPTHYTQPPEYCETGKRQGGGSGQWAIYYTSPQSFIIPLSYSLAQQPWGLLLIGWFI